MKLTRVKTILLALLTMFFLCVVSIYPFLAKTEVVESEVLVVEGWVNINTLNQVANGFQTRYKHLIATGGPVSGQDFLLTTTSSLKFNFRKMPTFDSNRKRIIEVLATGSRVDNIYSHFKVAINDSVIGETYTYHLPNKYLFDVPTGIDSIHSVSIFFDNDAVSGTEDRNLAINYIKINGKIYRPFQDGVRHEFHRKDSVESKPVYKSIAERARMFLMDMGVSQDKIIAVSAPAVQYDRTYESALAVEKFISSQMPHIKSINVISEGAHARRTWLMYRKAFGEDFKIGIISIREERVSPHTWWKSRIGISRVTEQFFKYLYALLYFYPFG